MLDQMTHVFQLVNAVADGDLTSLIEAVSNLEWVDALLKEFLGLLKDGSSKHNDTSGAVTDLVVLRSGKLSQKSGSLVMDL